MSKAEVIEKCVSDYVVTPETIVSSFSKWWVSVDLATTVPVRFPHEWHGNAGKPSNHAKTETNFLSSLTTTANKMVDPQIAVVPHSTFHQNFQQLKPLSQMFLIMESFWEDQWLGNLIAFNENKAMQSRPQLIVYCSLLKLPQRMLRNWKENLEMSMKITSSKYYAQVIKKCSDEWAKITSLGQKETLTDGEVETLTGLKNNFIAVICLLGFVTTTWKHLLSSEAKPWRIWYR